ncbi:MAG: RNA polymerase sigma-70 factor [Rhodothermales bacterium]
MESAEQFSVWCRQIKASDRKAFEDVFKATHDALVRYSLTFTRSTAASLDIIQDVFTKLWEVRHTLDPDRSLKALLYRMVRNLAFNHHRDTKSREAKHGAMSDYASSEVVRPDQVVGSDMLETMLHRWIDELPERQREALSLSRFDGLSHDEIAALMEISPRTVNNHLVKALKHIRDRIRAYEPNLLSHEG